MVLYQLQITPDDDAGDDENWDEWYPSLAAAKHRRTEIIKKHREDTRIQKQWEKDPHRDTYGPGVSSGPKTGRTGQIDKVIIAKLPPKQLALALLNQKQFVEHRETVVPEWVVPD